MISYVLYAPPHPTAPALCSYFFLQEEEWFFRIMPMEECLVTLLCTIKLPYLSLTLYRGASFNNSLRGTSEPTTPSSMPWDLLKTKENPFSEAKLQKRSAWTHTVAFLLTFLLFSLSLCTFIQSQITYCLWREVFLLPNTSLHFW